MHSSDMKVVFEQNPTRISDFIEDSPKNFKTAQVLVWVRYKWKKSHRSLIDESIDK